MTPIVPPTTCQINLSLWVGETGCRREWMVGRRKKKEKEDAVIVVWSKFIRKVLIRSTILFWCKFIWNYLPSQIISLFYLVQIYQKRRILIRSAILLWCKFSGNDLLLQIRELFTFLDLNFFNLNFFAAYFWMLVWWYCRRELFVLFFFCIFHHAHVFFRIMHTGSHFM